MKKLILAAIVLVSVSAAALAEDQPKLLEFEPLDEWADESQKTDNPAEAKKAAQPAAPAKAPAAVKKEQAAAAVTKTAAVKPALPAPAAKKATATKAAAAPKPAAAVKPVEVTEYPEKFELQPAKPAAAKAAVAAKPASPSAGSGGFSVEKKHLVSGGDTLWDLSGKYYKDPYKWGKIYNANLGVVENPDRIYPTEELLIPDITEEVSPKKNTGTEITGGDTVADADLSVTDVETAGEPVPAAAEPEELPKPATIKPVSAANLMSADLKAYARNDLSTELPVDQKEWSSFTKVVPDSWREDGVISAKEKNAGGAMEDSLSFSGEIVVITMSSPEPARKGDFLSVYRKGSTAFDARGKRIGKEIQPAGIVEVISVDGRKVRARIVDASSTLSKGLSVKFSLRR
ncbi:MAG TPA: hypothetical protein DCZ92_04425 [Elusimicrobia bacterium]|nr:MAG: hypothetical protein A2016_08230 [Elusimicrobia bacterium GWF2_62_30]HBA60058.1 hypothetical protein [Elusimicrobiota bacterium]